MADNSPVFLAGIPAFVIYRREPRETRINFLLYLKKKMTNTLAKRLARLSRTPIIGRTKQPSIKSGIARPLAPKKSEINVKDNKLMDTKTVVQNRLPKMNIATARTKLSVLDTKTVVHSSKFSTPPSAAAAAATERKFNAATIAAAAATDLKEAPVRSKIEKVKNHLSKIPKTFITAHAPVHVISIRPDRWARLQSQMSHWRPLLKMFPGTHGLKLDKKHLLKEGKITKRAFVHMKRGEFGVADSHRRLWQKVVDEKLPWLTVSEDDNPTFVPSERTLAQLQDIEKEIFSSTCTSGNADCKSNVQKVPKFDILFLRYCTFFKGRPRQWYSPRLFQPSKCQCMYTYVISQQGAQRLLKKMYPINDPVDVYVAQMADSDQISAWSLFPQMGPVRSRFLGSDTQAIV